MSKKKLEKAEATEKLSKPVKEEKISEGATGFNYKGIVSVSLKKGDKVINKHTQFNSGTERLFRSLLSYLCGFQNSQDSFRQFIPKYLDAGYTRTKLDFTSQVSPLSPLTGKLVDEVSVKVGQKSYTLNYAAVFTAIIPFSSIGTNSINRLKLVDTYYYLDKENPKSIQELAVLDLTQDIALPDSSYSFVVEWVMSINDFAEFSTGSKVQGY